MPLRFCDSVALGSKMAATAVMPAMTAASPEWTRQAESTGVRTGACGGRGPLAKAPVAPFPSGTCGRGDPPSRGSSGDPAPFPLPPPPAGRVSVAAAAAATKAASSPGAPPDGKGRNLRPRPPKRSVFARAEEAQLWLRRVGLRGEEGPLPPPPGSEAPLRPAGVSFRFLQERVGCSWGQPEGPLEAS